MAHIHDYAAKCTDAVRALKKAFDQHLPYDQTMALARQLVAADDALIAKQEEMKMKRENSMDYESMARLAGWVEDHDLDGVRSKDACCWAENWKDACEQIAVFYKNNHNLESTS